MAARVRMPGELDFSGVERKALALQSCGLDLFFGTCYLLPVAKDFAWQKRGPVRFFIPRIAHNGPV
jgi:maltodextrin utilization protein YvdJ